jgi:rhodanese-related sulfurtransferase
MIRNVRTIFFEAVVLLVVGVLFALFANRLSPVGLSLKRDYFARQRHPTITTNTGKSSAAPDPRESHETALEERLRSKGLIVIATKEAEQLFRDPQYEQELIVFVDARNDRHYQEGHIPGAYQFDHYYPEKYLPMVLPACMNATKVVVYCTGGKCEDSEFAAATLVEAGIPASNIAVYVGGITDWLAEKGPIETGTRKSGVLRTQTP